MVWDHVITSISAQGMRILILIPVMGPLVMTFVAILWDVLLWVAINAIFIIAFGAGLYRMLNAGVELNSNCDEDEVRKAQSSF